MEPAQIHLEIKKPLVIGDTTFISTNDFRATQYDIENAYRNLNESEERKIHCLEELKIKLTGDQKVIYRTDDEYLLRYLRHTKFNCDKAYKIIRKFYSLRAKYTEFFTIPSTLETLLDCSPFTYLPYTTEEGYVMFWFDFRKWKLEEMSILQLIQSSLVLLDVITMNPKMQINGIIEILDFRGATAKHIMQVVYPSTVWFMSKAFQDAYPWRIKWIMLTHVSKFVRTTIETFKYLIKTKIYDRLQLIGSDIEELHKYINPNLIPKDYGGMLEESECRVTQDIVQNLPYVRYERSFGEIKKS